METEIFPPEEMKSTTSLGGCSGVILRGVFCTAEPEIWTEKFQLDKTDASIFPLEDLRCESSEDS